MLVVAIVPKKLLGSPPARPSERLPFTHHYCHQRPSTHGGSVRHRCSSCPGLFLLLRYLPPAALNLHSHSPPAPQGTTGIYRPSPWPGLFFFPSHPVPLFSLLDKAIVLPPSPHPFSLFFLSLLQYSATASGISRLRLVPGFFLLHALVRLFCFCAHIALTKETKKEKEYPRELDVAWIPACVHTRPCSPIIYPSRATPPPNAPLPATTPNLPNSNP